MSESKLSARLLCTTALVAVVWAGSVAVSNAQTADGAVEEIVVTGSRIIREGYSAPTPLAVVDQAQIENRSDPNLTVSLVQMPAFSGAGVGQTTSGGLSSSTSGTQTLNLRNLGPLRTLVLLDGQRTVGSSASGQGVDINSYPQQLVQRVDIVTGGASAVYGSDAVAGVVNFIIDKNFTGFKADVGGGVTNYGDMKNFALRASAGFSFAGGRGHILLSGEEYFNEGIDGDGGRAWNRTGKVLYQNPAATATNGLPAQLYSDQVGQPGATPGGIVLNGPLRGVYFGEGGVPAQFNYGESNSPTQNIGGDWFYTDRRRFNDQMAQEHRQNLFFRGSFDITDNINAHIQTFFTKSHVEGYVSPPYFFGAGSARRIRVDNAFLPESVRTRMVAAGVTQIQVGSWHQDFGQQYANNIRTVWQSNAGFDGNFDAFGSNWTWNANASLGISKPDLEFQNTFVIANYEKAIDAVRGPNGSIVCRVTLTNPNDPCVPVNILGTNVNGSVNTGDIRTGNDSPGLTYVKGGSSQSNNRIEQQHYTASISGEPFSLWAGPVSLALSAEHRIEQVLNVPDPIGAVAGRSVGNLPVLDGQQSVTEGAIETVIPLANGLSWADNWDFNGAVRFTDYELAGFVTTWKVGTTYSPIPDIKFRGTLSRDIRAPNLQELFQPSAFSQGVLRDPVTNTSPSVRQFALGNPNLEPEKSNTLGLGVVLTPRFFPGFAFSADYFDVDVKGTIATVSSQVVLDNCFRNGDPDFCSNVFRAPNGTLLEVYRRYFNIARQNVRGIDFESSYRTDLFGGQLSLHANVTHYLDNIQDDTRTPVSNHVGDLAGPAKWRGLINATYKYNAFTLGMNVRGVSGGVINNQWIECQSGCPASVAPFLTIDNNQYPGAIYLDLNFAYDFEVGGAATTAYFSARNIMDHDPKGDPTSANYSNLGLGIAGDYDVNGVVFRGGFRFRM